jgi:hypothetical protein
MSVSVSGEAFSATEAKEWLGWSTNYSIHIHLLVSAAFEISYFLDLRLACSLSASHKDFSASKFPVSLCGSNVTSLLAGIKDGMNLNISVYKIMHPSLFHHINYKSTTRSPPTQPR